MMKQHLSAIAGKGVSFPTVKSGPDWNVPQFFSLPGILGLLVPFARE
jgi:hypothetical protein